MRKKSIMGKIIYYSNYCENCKNLLNIISKTDLQKSMHFICIDKRNNKNGKIYIVLETNQEVLLPDNITSVPALLLLQDNFRTLFGNEILDYLKPIEKEEKNIATNYQGEPDSYSMGRGGGCVGGMTGVGFGFGVMSDAYSFLDQSLDDLSAKGDGGLRQMYNYSTLNQFDKIETPPEDYIADKIGSVDMETLKTTRNKDAGIQGQYPI